MRMFVAYLLAACAPTRTATEQTVAALQSVGTGDPAALSACTALPSDALIGMCVAAYAEAAPLEQVTPAVCAPLADESWRSECFFVRAERVEEAGDFAAAVESCRAAGLYVRDCARHLWKAEGARSPERTDETLSKLREAFPEHALAFDPSTQVTRGMLFQDRLRGEERLSETLCTPQDGDECSAALRRLLQRRWEREAQGSAEIRAWLCEPAVRGELPECAAPLPLRLCWVRSEMLDEAVRTAQERVCE